MFRVAWACLENQSWWFSIQLNQGSLQFRVHFQTQAWAFFDKISFVGSNIFKRNFFKIFWEFSVELSWLHICWCHLNIFSFNSGSLETENSCSVIIETIISDFGLKWRIHNVNLSKMRLICIILCFNTLSINLERTVANHPCPRDPISPIYIFGTSMLMAPEPTAYFRDYFMNLSEKSDINLLIFFTKLCLSPQDRVINRKKWMMTDHDGLAWKLIDPLFCPLKLLVL